MDFMISFELYSVYLQEVAVKKFLDQEFYGDALDEFRCEVGEEFAFDTHKFLLNAAFLFQIQLPLLQYLLIQILSFLIGEDYAPSSTSKYCALYGCSNKAPKFVHCIRISTKVQLGLL
jgi:hypothetical protein